MQDHKTVQDHKTRALERILSRGRMRVRYQPIIDLASGEAMGFEALSRVEADDVFTDAHTLFAFAEESRHIVELERLCRRQALDQAAHREHRGKLLLNCSAYAFADPYLVPDLLAGAAFLGLEPRDLVVELTERVPVTDWRRFMRTVGDLRRAGLGFAVDDFGSGCATLETVLATRPDYVKLDRDLIRDLHLLPVKAELLAAVVGWVGEMGAEVIAEGIEKPEELAAVQRLGARYGQGYLLGRPRAAELPHAALTSAFKSAVE